MTPKTKPAAVRAAIYARQSVQEDERIAEQIIACEHVVAARGFELVDTYRDNNVSGYKVRGEGTAFAQMLSDAHAGRFDVLVVRKLDRLARSLSALEALTAAKVAVVTSDGEVDLTTVNGRLMANVLTSVARAESETKAERRVFANKARRRDGVPTSGRVPYGYMWVPTKVRADRVKAGESGEAYERDPDRADDVRRIFEMFLAGVPLGSIARDLNEAGKRTAPYKRGGVVVAGVPFTATTLRRILLSPYYAALLPLPPEDGEQRPYDQAAITRESCEVGKWPAIVTVAQWEAAKAKLAHPDRRTSPGPTRRWLLSGLALCGVCDRPIHAGGGEKGVHSYRCGSMAHFMRRGDPLDAYVERYAVEYIAKHRGALLEPRERADAGALIVELAKLDAALAELGQDRDEGVIDRAEYMQRRGRIVSKRDGMRRELAAGADRSTLEGIVGSGDVLAAWQALTLGEKRTVLGDLFEIRVHSVGQGNRRNMPAEKFAKTITITSAGGA
ncbi:recombinase family protein [Microbacterium sp. cx-55]|uniref:recombinase family protein n=1 Tax=Microbacterium sp. cx-55 TaxID=2875948 RepID=UPI001CBF8324|nr:recombinase family protein [Microbacterium sp. cx-55]MBZ4488019.1 recombinase family protein [Microbacterium sp. cx-55]UGB34575.1 recombinase family protein [Microbacterium sp. cx-55]